MGFLVVVQSLLPLRWGQMKSNVRVSANWTCLNESFIHLMPRMNRASLCCPCGGDGAPPACLSVVCLRCCVLTCSEEAGLEPVSTLPYSAAIAVIYTGAFGCQRRSCTSQSGRALAVKPSAFTLRLTRALWGYLWINYTWKAIIVIYQ